MKKNFIQVQKIKIVTTSIVLAGIAFTLFGCDAVEATAVEFRQETVVCCAEVDTASSISPDGNIVLASNEQSTADKISLAYSRFVSDKGGDSSLDDVCGFMADEMKAVRVDKVSVDGSVDDGLLNMSFRLPDGMILSVNKRRDTMDSRLVAFNIIRDRRLVISDVMDIHNLREYINTVQARLA